MGRAPRRIAALHAGSDAQSEAECETAGDADEAEFEGQVEAIEHGVLIGWNGRQGSNLWR